MGTMRTEAEIHSAIAANAELLAGILRLVPDVDIDQTVPCTRDLWQRCPLLAPYAPTTVPQALLDVRAQVRRLQHALGMAQGLGARENEIAAALGSHGQQEAPSETLRAPVPVQGN